VLDREEGRRFKCNLIVCPSLSLSFLFSPIKGSGLAFLLGLYDVQWFALFKIFLVLDIFLSGYFYRDFDCVTRALDKVAVSRTC